MSSFSFIFPNICKDQEKSYRVSIIFAFLIVQTQIHCQDKIYRLKAVTLLTHIMSYMYIKTSDFIVPFEFPRNNKRKKWGMNRWLLVGLTTKRAQHNSSHTHIIESQ